MSNPKSLIVMCSWSLLLLITYCSCIRYTRPIPDGRCHKDACRPIAYGLLYFELDANETDHEYCIRLRVWKECLMNLSVVCALSSDDQNYLEAQHVFNDKCKNYIAIYQSNSLAKPKILPPLTCMHPGKKKFSIRYCEFYNYLNLKTFKNVDQICQFEGKRMLIDNPYMSVEVIAGRIKDFKTIFPLKFSVLVKGFLPCLMEKRYEAVYNSSLPLAFLDGDKQSKSNHTFVSKSKSYKDGQKESVEIIIDHINSKITIEREGELLGFRAAIPRSLFPNGDIGIRDREHDELCHTGCLID